MAKTSEKSDWQISQDHKVLDQRIIRSFKKYKKRKYFDDFRATRHSGVCDCLGIDWVVNFCPNGNGERGDAIFQEKRSKSAAKEHLKKHPIVPAFLAKIGDAEMLVNYIIISLLLTFNAYNRDKESAIIKEKRRLKAKISKNRREAMGKRLWCNNFDPKI